MDKEIMAKTRRNLERIRILYKKLADNHPDELPSIGIVSRWGGVGSGKGGNRSITEIVAMQRLTLTEEQERLIAWVDAIRAVCDRLSSKEGKNSIKRQRELKLANILRSKVFDGAEMSYIRKAYFRDGVSVQYVHRVYDSIVEMVAEEALRRGLLEQTSA